MERYELEKQVEHEAVTNETYKMVRAIYDELQIEKKEVDKKKK